MQTHGGQAAEEAIVARERRFSHRLLVDWGRDGTFSHPLSDLTGYASTVVTDRTLAGSVPNEVTLIEGAAAASLTATLGGEYDGQGLVEVFSPYNGRSPLYLQDVVGCDVSYSILVHTVVGTVEYPQFEGMVRALSPDRRSGTVELECLDRVEVLRRPINLPQWAIIQRLSGQGVVEAQLANSQWVIDHCLRYCDTSPTTYRHTYRSEMNIEPEWSDGVQFWLSGTGAALPTRGWVDNSNAQSFPHTEAGDPPMYTAGVGHPDNEPGDPAPLCLNAAPPAGDELRFWAQDRDLFDPHGTHFLGVTVLPAEDGFFGAGQKELFRIHIGEQSALYILVDGRVATTRYSNFETGANYEASYYVDVPAEHYEIVAVWDTVRHLFDDTTDDKTAVTIGVNTDELSPFKDVAPALPFLTTDDPLKGLCVVQHPLRIQEVCHSFRDYTSVSDTPDVGELRRRAKYRAVLDSGNNRLSYMPTDLDGTDAWDIIKAVAAAEWGAVFWDERGVFRFWNWDTLRAKQNDVVRVLSVDDVSGLSARNSLDSVRNVFNVEATKKVAAMGTVFEARDENEFIVPAYSTKLFRIWDTSVICPYPFKVPRYTTIANHPDTNFPTWGDDNVEGYVVQFLIDGVWQEANHLVSGVDIYAYFNLDGYLVVNIQNGYEYDARLAKNGSEAGSGEAAFRLQGTKILDSDPQVFTSRYEDSIAAYGERNLKLSGTWYQDGFRSAQMIDTLAERTTRPVPTTEALTVPGDPRLQLGDTLEIQDPQGFGSSLKVQVLGIQREWHVDKGLSDRLTVELLRPPGQWVLGSSGYSVLGRSTVLTSGAYEALPNPGFEDGIDGWGSYAGTVEPATDVVHSGAGSLRVVPNGVSTVAVAQTDPLVSLPGTWTGGAWACSPGGWPTGFVQLVWLDADRQEIGVTEGQASGGLPAQQWVWLSVTGDAPDGTTFVALRVFINETPSTGDVFYVDDALVRH